MSGTRASIVLAVALAGCASAGSPGPGGDDPGIGGGQGLAHGSEVGPCHDRHAGHARIQERANTCRQHGPSRGPERERGFGGTHPGGRPGREDDGGNHRRALLGRPARTGVPGAGRGKPGRLTADFRRSYT